MPKIQLIEGGETLVDEIDLELLSQSDWFLMPNGYVARYKDNGAGTWEFMHRVIMETPKDRFTDHVNGDKLDNRRNNLRVCTYSQNRANARKQIFKNKVPTSRYKGVCKKTPNRNWTASVKHIHLGSFITEEDAAKAYDKKAKELFGEFALLNFS